MMKKLQLLLIISLFVLTFSTINVFGQTASGSGQVGPATAYSLLVENEDGKQTKLSLADLGKLKRQTIKAKDHDAEGTFEGYLLADVLKLGGIEFGETMRGKRLATFLLVGAADQYQAVFALPEIDAGFTDKIIILADRRDGKPLSEKEGVLRVIVPDEKRQGRWVRQVISLKIARAGK